MQQRLDVLMEREDRRIRLRREEADRCRRKLLPAMVAVCEIYGVSPDDILSRSVHPDVVMARNVLIWLGYSRYKIGVTALADLLRKSRPELSKKISRLRILAQEEQGPFSAALTRTIERTK